jgi:hypothetical protein
MSKKQMPGMPRRSEAEAGECHSPNRATCRSARLPVNTNVVVCKTLLMATVAFGFAVVVMGAEAVQEQSQSSAAILAAAVNESAVSAGKAAVARDVAVNALRNAVAVCKEIQERLVDAIKSGNRDKIKELKKSLKTSNSELDEAIETAEDLTGEADETISAHTAALDVATRVSTSGSEGELKKARKEIERFVAVAAKAARKTENLAEILKKKWLNPATATTIQPIPALNHLPSTSSSVPSK